jgi:hypothetical protein
MSWVWHVAKTRKMTTGYNISVRKPKVNRPQEDVGIDGRFSLKWISR